MSFVSAMFPLQARNGVRQMLTGKKIKQVRSDSAAYQAEIINYYEDHGIQFAI
jgi:hypothetical protein